MKHFDTGSLIIIVITFILFAFALFTTGFTHDLLLEAGVFLVSVKLIVMAYKSSIANEAILSELIDIKRSVNSDKSNVVKTITNNQQPTSYIFLTDSTKHKLYSE